MGIRICLKLLHVKSLGQPGAVGQGASHKEMHAGGGRGNLFPLPCRPARPLARWQLKPVDIRIAVDMEVIGNQGAPWKGRILPERLNCVAS